MKLQNDLAGIDYIIIDEFSVVGQNMLGWIDSCCKQATGCFNKVFGGINVMLLGDIAQLPPVSDCVLYHTNPTNAISTSGFHAYHCFEKVVKLSVNHRANGDNMKQQEFRDLLLRLRNGENTFFDWSILQNRFLYNISDQPNFLKYAVKLSFSIEKVCQNNYECLREEGKPIAYISARHSNNKAASLPADDMGGLSPKLFLCKGARVMLTRNLWTEVGLCNGAMGSIFDIIYSDRANPPSLPTTVIVQFDEGYKGPSVVPTTPRCIYHLL